MSRYVPLLAAALAVTASLLWANALRLQPFDDALITLQAAKNLASGNGPVFNAGERVESATSPLWTAILAAADAAGIDPVTAVLPLALAAVAAAAAMSAQLATDLAGPWAGLLAAVILALLPSWSCWPGTGMEVPLAGFAISASLLVATRTTTRRGAVGTGLLAAAAAFSRPEAMLLVPIAAFAAGRNPGGEGRKRVVAALVAAAVPITALVFARRLYFGTFVPNTYVAKREGLAASVALWRGGGYVTSFLCFHFAGAVAVVRAALRRGPSLIAAAACAAFAAADVWEGGDHFPLGRMIAPILPVACALAGAELWKLPLRAVTIPTTLALSAVLQLGLPEVFPGFGPAVGVSRLRYEAMFVRGATEVAFALRQLPAGRVASLAIGAVGYYSGHAVLDLVGLADAHIAHTPHLPGAHAGHDHADVGYVLAQRPQLVLLIPSLRLGPMTGSEEDRWLVEHKDFFISALMLERNPGFRQLYRPVDESFPDGRHLRVWVRADLAK